MSKLLFRQTDSHMEQIEMPDLYNDLIQMKEYFDLSNFDPSKRYYQPDFGTTKAVVAKMEEERRAIVITEFEGFRPPISPFEIV